MCGRYNLIADADAVCDFFEVAKSTIVMHSLTPRYNIAPSQDVPAIRQIPTGRELVMLRWGLIPSWSKTSKMQYNTINARADTVESKPAYRNAFKRHRCILPSTGFYEWQADGSEKQSFYIGLENQALFGMAGLWEHWEGEDGAVIESCSIIVTEANEAVSTVHDRMPVILHRKDYDLWLDIENHNIDQLKALLKPYESIGMVAYAISKHVNSPKNDDPQCLERIAVKREASK